MSSVSDALPSRAHLSRGTKRARPEGGVEIIGKRVDCFIRSARIGMGDLKEVQYAKGVVIIAGNCANVSLHVYDKPDRELKRVFQKHPVNESLTPPNTQSVYTGPNPGEMLTTVQWPNGSDRPAVVRPSIYKKVKTVYVTSVFPCDPKSAPIKCGIKAFTDSNFPNLNPSLSGMKSHYEPLEQK